MASAEDQLTPEVSAAARQELTSLDENWLRMHTCVGARCGECGKPFTSAGARRFKGLVGVPNGAGYSIYALCRPCARRFRRHGPAAIPNALEDSRLATMLHFMPVRGHA
jgi:hypothetical protein